MNSWNVAVSRPRLEGWAMGQDDDHKPSADIPISDWYTGPSALFLSDAFLRGLRGAKTPRNPIPIPAKNRPASIMPLFWHAVCSTPPIMNITPAVTTGMSAVFRLSEHNDLLAVRRLNASAIKEAGIEATKALPFSLNLHRKKITHPSKREDTMNPM